jgi:murein DD-endopeptidase MepM/ murein hydrolase activator NlpD
MKKIVIIFLALVFLAGCSCQKSDKKPKTITNRYNISLGTDVRSFIDSLDYMDSAFITDIIGERIALKSAEQDSYLEVETGKKSHKIHSVNYSAFNVQYNIQVPLIDSVNYRVQAEKPILKGGSIFGTLSDLGMKPKQVGYFAWAMGEHVDATSIDVGDIITADYYIDSLNVKHFQKFSYRADKINIHEFTILGERELEHNLIIKPHDLRRKLLTGEITEQYVTLDAAMANLGIIPYIRQQANNALDSQIAFSTDARIGDTFRVYIEEIWVDSVREERGKMLFAKYSGKYTRTKSAYRFSDNTQASAFTGMYTPKGKRLVTDAVRTPLDRMHISSSFGYRIHPISGKRRMHQGIDLRGSRGTTIYAVTNGKIIKASNNGNGYGKEVQIRHDNGMISQYAHLSRISIRNGRRVKKGQIIGKVGSTGNSTGAHLHFGVKKNGRWVNPKTNLKMVGANQLKGNRLTAFKKQLKQLETEITNLQPTAADSLQAKK